MGYGLGVDLGTSFTGAAISRDGFLEMVTLGEYTILLPSVIRVQPDGSLASGESLNSDTDGDPTSIGRDFKRRLGDPTPLVLGGQPHSAVSLLAATLSAVVAKVTRIEGEPPERVTLTYPAVWGPYRREQFAEVPRRAGLDLDTVTVITEPEAAAAHYATRERLAEGDVVAVYDLGGGTFDTTVTRVQGIGTDGRIRMELLGIPEGVEWVGGVDFDEAVLAYADQAVGGAISALDTRDQTSALALQRIRKECTRAKEVLSRDIDTSILIDLPGRQTRIPLTRSEFEDMIQIPLESTMAAVHRTIESAGTTPDALAGVLLIGGSSRIPLVAQMLSQTLGRPVQIDPDPQHCVTLGAAAIADGLPVTQVRSLASPEVVGRRRRRQRLTAAVVGAAALIGVIAYAVTSGLLDSKEPTSRAASLESAASPSATSGTAPTGSPTGTTGASEATDSATPSASGSTDTKSPTSSETTSATHSAKAKPKPKASKASPKSDPVSPLVGFTGTVTGIGGECMDIVNARADPNAIVQIFECNGSKAQIWTGGSHTTIRGLGACAEAAGADAANGNQVLMQPCNESTAQQWTVSSSKIVNKGSGLCLDTLDSSSTDRTPLIVRACNGNSSQHWTLS